MQPPTDPVDLYRHTKIAQRLAEQSGFADTARALAAVAEMIALEAGAGAARVRPPAVVTPRSIASPLPIYRRARG